MPLDDTAPPDYENHIPAAVRRQSARAEEIARQIGMANVPSVDTGPPPDPPPLAEPPVPVVTQGEPQAPASAPLAQVPAPPAPTAPPAGDWEQKYRSLKGKYDSEIAGLQGQLASLHQIIEGMRAAPPAPPPPPPPAASAPPVAPSREDEETYGRDLIEAAQRWAVARVMPEIEALRRELAEVKTIAPRVEQVAAENAQQRIMAALDADPAIGRTWRQVNEQPEFIEWLNQQDPFTGQQRMALLREAFVGGKVAQTAAFFNAFLREQTAVSPPPAAPPPQTPAQPEAGRPSLEAFAAPGRPAAAPAPAGAPPEKRIWTPQTIRDFYRQVQRGVFNGREAEKLRLENDIIAAAQEGRVRQ